MFTEGDETVKIELNAESFAQHFLLKKYSGENPASFCCKYQQYSNFLTDSAGVFQEKHLSTTYIAVNRLNGDIVAYMSLATSSALVSSKDKKSLGIEIKPMDNIPAIKVTQLAVDQLYAQRYKNVGKNMIFFARMLACRCSEIAACSILTVDADVETNLGVDQFYEKCGFQRLKREISQKRKRIGNDVALKTIPMWSPLFI